MKPLFNWLYNKFIKPNEIKDEIKGCIELTFKGKTLAQSIAINQKYNEAFRIELNDQHVKKFNDLELIENYFNPKRKDIYKIDVKDPIFEKSIQQ